MPLIRQLCPDCGDDWEASRMMPCGKCYLERNAVVWGVVAKPARVRESNVHPDTQAQIDGVSAEAAKYVT